MSVIRNLILSIKANTGNYDKKISRSQKLTKSFQKSVTKMALKIGGLITVAKGIGAVVRSFERLDKLAKTSAKLGFDPARLAGLQFAAKKAGIEVSTLNEAMQRMVRRVNEASHGTGEAQAALKELGLDAAKLTQLAPDQQFLQIAAAMNRIGLQGDRVREMFKLFDSGGVALLTLAQQGTKEIEKQIELGARFSGVQGQGIAGIEAAMNRVANATAQWEGATNKLALALIPVVKSLAGMVDEAARIANFITPGSTVKGNDVGDLHARPDKTFADSELGRARAEMAASMVAVNTTFAAYHKAAKEFEDIGKGFGKVNPLNIPAMVETAQTRDMAALNNRFARDRLRRARLGIQQADTPENRQKLVDLKIRIEKDRKIAEMVKTAAANKIAQIKEVAKQEKVWAAQRIALAKSVFSATRTPLENFKKRVFDLENLLGSGAINRETFTRAKQQAREALPEFAERMSRNAARNAAIMAALRKPIEQRGLRPSRRLGPEPAIAALERGSQAALSEINRIKARQDAKGPEKQAVKELKEVNDNLKEQIRFLEENKENDIKVAAF